ncbi:MAG: redoxin domain-containing protein [bacterium]|nr:redoxin domain-containing protein [bacterium]
MHSLLPTDRKDRTVIVGIAPDTQETIGRMVGKVTSSTGKEFEITLLADAEHKVIDRYGLLNENAAKRGRFLPHPTTYVLDKTGVVRWKFTEVDYKIRPTNEMILEQLNKLD